MIRRAVTLAMAAASFGGAHDVVTTKITWSREVSRVVYARCAGCHAAGRMAFSLMTYAEARPWAKAIKEETGSRRMPPWQAVKGFADFRDDHGLTQEEIELIANWVEGGAPEGDARLLPASPKTARWLIPASPAGTLKLDVSNGSQLTKSVRVVGVRSRSLAAGESLQAVAIRPDGSVLPLLWLYGFNPKFQQTYSFRTAVNLPAGTRIRISGPRAAGLSLTVSS